MRKIAYNNTSKFRIHVDVNGNAAWILLMARLDIREQYVRWFTEDIPTITGGVISNFLSRVKNTLQCPFSVRMLFCCTRSLRVRSSKQCILWSRYLWPPTSVCLNLNYSIVHTPLHLTLEVLCNKEISRDAHRFSGFQAGRFVRVSNRMESLIGFLLPPHSNCCHFPADIKWLKCYWVQAAMQ